MLSLADKIKIASDEGPLLIGMMAGYFLFGVLCSQAAYYYRTYPHDHVLIKVTIGCLLVLEVAHVALLSRTSHFVFVYCRVLENIGGTDLIITEFAASVVITFIITTVVQIFYTWRVKTLSNAHRWGRLITGLILTANVVQCCAGLATAIQLFGDPTNEAAREGLLQRLASATWAATVVCDLSICLALVYFLNCLRSGISCSESLINRLILLSINVGAVTSIIAICTLVTFYATPRNSVSFSAFIEISGKFYVNSILVTLNSRKNARRNLKGTWSMHLSDLTTTQGGETK